MQENEVKEDLKLEEVMDKLEEKIRLLEEGNFGLEESYKIFTEGMELVKTGNSTIDRVEKELKILIEDE